MKTVLVIFGTRPEAIKMAPVVRALEESHHLYGAVCVTAQHREMLDQALRFFQIEPDFDLDIMTPNQDLFGITTLCLNRLREVYASLRPDVVLVHGDTTTTLSASLAAYYMKIPIGHVEAGLRTGDKYAPFPEEMNRNMIAPLVDFHFAPTKKAIANLHMENIAEKKIFLTGNTAIDSLLWTVENKLDFPELQRLFAGKKMILMTAHRRENFGEPLRNIFSVIRTFAEKYPNFQIIYPVHPNPNVKELANSVLGEIANVSLIAPVGYAEMAYLIKECQFVITDSGGLQEEGPTLGKPVLVMRETTERPEATEAGCAKLVGSSRERIFDCMEQLTDVNAPLYLSMSRAINPFGDGTAGKKIVGILERVLMGFDVVKTSILESKTNSESRQSM